MKTRMYWRGFAALAFSMGMISGCGDDVANLPKEKEVAQTPEVRKEAEKKMELMKGGYMGAPGVPQSKGGGGAPK